MEGTKETSKNDFKKLLIVYGILFAAFIAIGFLVPDNPDDFGILTTIPAI